MICFVKGGLLQCRSLWFVLFFLSIVSIGGISRTDAQIPQSTSSVSATDLEAQARSKGYSAAQIDQLKKRYASQPSAVPLNNSSKYTGLVAYEDYLSGAVDSIKTPLPDLKQTDTVITKSEIVIDSTTLDSELQLPYFGHSVFGAIPDAFKPNASGPVDPGYLAGPGDVLRLSVWGEVEFQYELKITREGKVFIPVAGQMYVTGIPFEKLQLKIQALLSKHYSGLASTPQKSFMDLSVARRHPIRIFMMGEVKAPGGYTVSISSTAFNALYSVGGPLVSGTLRDITVIRNQEEVAHVDLYDYLVTGQCTTDVRLLNDDVVFTRKRGKTVAVVGAVFRPACYELHGDEHLLDLLRFCGGVLPESNAGTAVIRRVLPVGMRSNDVSARKVVNVGLQQLFTDSTKIELYDNDTLEVVPLSDDLQNYATISGAVKYPGRYQVDGLSLYSIVFLHGKLIDRLVFTGRADLVRLNPDKVTSTIRMIDLEALKRDSAAHNLMLQPYDEVIVYKKEVEKPLDLLVTVDGEVHKPGTYLLSTNQTVVDVLLRAGGFTRSAYTSSVDVFRLMLSNDGSDTITESFNINLPDSIDFTAPRDGQFLLHDRDHIVVRPNPSYVTDNYVSINGLVKFRGTYAIKMRGERLSDLVKRAGGLLPDAFLGGATVRRNGRRVVVDFREALSGVLSKENILLQKNDTITIPPRPNTVLVSGNVNNLGLFSYVAGSKLRTYINRAGGFADSTAFILLTSPGGETLKVGKRGFSNPVVKDGSEIVVMRKQPKDRTADKQGPTIAEVVRDTLAILASAVTVIGLAVQLSN